MPNATICGDVVEEHGDYQFEIHCSSGQTHCSKIPLGAGADNKEDIRPTDLPDTMRQQYAHLLPLFMA